MAIPCEPAILDKTGLGGPQTDLIILLLFVINRYIFMLYLCILTHTVIQPFATRVWN